MIDVRVLDKGLDYRKLKKSFVIFICNYDPFGKSRLIYTFRNRCDEDYSIILPDEASKIIINTKGTIGDISDELRAVIQYMDSGSAMMIFIVAAKHFWHSCSYRNSAVYCGDNLSMTVEKRFFVYLLRCSDKSLLDPFPAKYEITVVNKIRTTYCRHCYCHS